VLTCESFLFRKIDHTLPVLIAHLDNKFKDDLSRVFNDPWTDVKPM